MAANFIGESILFSAAVLAVTAEAYRKKLDENAKEKQAELNKQILEDRIQKLERALEAKPSVT